ncbi:uncharacterized protein LOC114529111 [Dendronephthya gigantea]|uniref:uncharacterized protein LOC114529111 n=1 Tax=Dendronephthya gigantea TaxID=151771 RepID=UPI001069B87C|nr:uncharacterized protein LOC114529111 [Dendronephthya gigantea]
MGECIFENAGNFMADSYQTNRKLSFPQTFGKSTYMEQQFLCTSSDNRLVDAELEYFNQILNEQYDKPTSSESSTAMEENLSDLIEENMKPQSISQDTCQLLQKLQRKRVNLVLVATSLEESDVVQRLKSSLDPLTSSMIPLSFEESKSVGVDRDHPGFELASIKHEGEAEAEDGKNTERYSKGKQQLGFQETISKPKDAKYWKRRSSNNEAARRSREAKRIRFIWIQNRTKELEIENSSLQKELKILEQKVLEQENKKAEK